MADTRSEKLNASLGAVSKDAGADAAGADTVPIVIPSAAVDRELSDEDLDKVSGGANSGGGDIQRVRPQARAL